MRFEAAGFGILLVGLAFRHIRRRFQFVVVIGRSMSPTFNHGDLVIGRRHITTVSRGDVIVFRIYPGDYEDGRDPGSAWLSRRVKRVVATQGHDAPGPLRYKLTQGHNGLVPPGHVAVAGDNPHSESSADFGYVEIERVESVVVRRLGRRTLSVPTVGT